MFKRKIYGEMQAWKNESDGTSALLIEGARRIGKSTVVEEFARNEYRDYVIIDFSIANNDIKENFDNIGDLDTFFRNLFILVEKSLPVRESVIIFDEVQLFPKARQAIKHLVKDGRYDYIETGSLISINKNVKDILIPSEEESIKMYPMDFEEFLWANGNSIYADSIRDSFEKRKAMGDAVHRKVMQKFRAYLAVGGMPQAIEAYVEGKDYGAIDRIKRNIIKLYIKDLEKHDQNDGDRAGLVFKSIPDQLANHNSVFKLAVVDNSARMRNCANAIEFLERSMISNNCYNVTQPEITFEQYADRTKLKMFMGDTGLLVTYLLQSNKDTSDKLYRALIMGRLEVNQGFIFENMVAQMLRAAGHELYFHEFKYSADDNASEKSYEVDFMIAKGKRLIPIEVKSSGYKTHKSFDYFIKKYRVKTNERYIIYTKDLSFEDGITYIPVYMTMCL